MWRALYTSLTAIMPSACQVSSQALGVQKWADAVASVDALSAEAGRATHEADPRCSQRFTIVVVVD